MLETLDIAYTSQKWSTIDLMNSVVSQLTSLEIILLNC